MKFITGHGEGFPSSPDAQNPTEKALNAFKLRHCNLNTLLQSEYLERHSTTLNPFYTIALHDQFTKCAFNYTVS